VSRDNRRVLGVTRHKVLVWDVESRALQRVIDVPNADPSYLLYQPLRVCVSPDWRWLFVRHNYGNSLKVRACMMYRAMAICSTHTHKTHVLAQ
jgi:hypothetical protein